MLSSCEIYSSETQLGSESFPFTDMPHVVDKVWDVIVIDDMRLPHL